MGTVPDTRENLQRCICGECPTMPADDTGFYCAKGESPKDVNQRGCICGDCDVSREYGLSGGYYCVEGAA